MSIHHEVRRPDGSVIEFAFTERSDGDFHIDAEATSLRERRASVMPGQWAVVRQVHGARVVDASVVSGDPVHAPEADAVMTSQPGQPIAVQGADCAPLMFVTDTGPIAVAHAGWRGLEAGVVQTVLGALGEQGATVSRIVVGPVINQECYEFGADDLDLVAKTLGDEVRGTTAEGTAALDMRGAIAAACASAGVDDVVFARPCTGCGDGGFSHRARQEPERHALVARIRPAKVVA